MNRDFLIVIFSLLILNSVMNQVSMSINAHQLDCLIEHGKNWAINHFEPASYNRNRINETKRIGKQRALTHPMRTRTEFLISCQNQYDKPTSRCYVEIDPDNTYQLRFTVPNHAIEICTGVQFL